MNQRHLERLREIVGDPLVDGVMTLPAHAHARIRSQFTAFIRSRAAFDVEYVEVRKLHNDEDLCYRWLASRRDYPYYRCDPPEVHDSVMRRCLAEFTRSNPGFKL